MNMLQCQNDDLNQVEVSLKANPGHLRINVEKIWSCLDWFGVCSLECAEGSTVFDGCLHNPLHGCPIYPHAHVSAGRMKAACHIYSVYTRDTMHSQNNYTTAWMPS